VVERRSLSVLLPDAGGSMKAAPHFVILSEAKKSASFMEIKAAPL
jgi:hypothetical protein